jgi:hypothetical protein
MFETPPVAGVHVYATSEHHGSVLLISFVETCVIYIMAFHVRGMASSRLINFVLSYIRFLWGLALTDCLTAPG